MDVMASCDCGMLLLELVMPLIVLYSFDVPVLWSNVSTNSFQFLSCSVFISVFMFVLSSRMCSVVCVVCGVGDCLRFSLIRRAISGVWLGL